MMVKVLALATYYRKWILSIILILFIAWAVVSPLVYFGPSHYSTSGVYWAFFIILITLYVLVYVLFFTDITKPFLKKRE